MKSTIIISDTHLGAPESAADELGAFLDNLAEDPPERLILNGDIIEFWYMEKDRALENARNYFKEHLVPLMAEGTEVVFIPGNHDYSVHTDLVAAYRSKGMVGVNELKKIFFPDHADRFQILYPHAVLKYREGTPEEKHVFITHGDVTDFLHAFTCISSLPLKEVKVVREDDWLRHVIRSVKPEDTYRFYTWLHEYTLKRDLTHADSPFVKITDNIKALQFFSYLLSHKENSYLTRINFSSFKTFDLLLLVIPLYGKDLKRFVNDSFEADVTTMAQRLISVFKEKQFPALLHERDWWEVYGNTLENKIDFSRTSAIIAGHLYREGRVSLDNHEVFFSGGWFKGDTRDVGSYVEIDEEGTIQQKNYLRPF